MVTINLNIRYDLTPEERKEGWFRMTEREREEGLVRDAIIPAVKNYLKDITESNVRLKKCRKKMDGGKK